MKVPTDQLLAIAGSVIAFTSVTLAGQPEEKAWKIEVLLNGRHLL